MPTIRNGQDRTDVGNSHAFREWLQVLARPSVFRVLVRLPTRAHLLALLDAYRPFAASHMVPAERQALALTERMREHLSEWSPPELTEEIVTTARALLTADGCYKELDWEKGPDLDPGETIEDIVTWPSNEPRTDELA